MARKKDSLDAAGIRLRQPDRSGPTEKTLLDVANERDLFTKANQRQKQKKIEQRSRAGNRVKHGEEGSAELSPLAERIMDTVLWCVSLAMLHLTLDVLVQHQYAMDVSYLEVARRAIQALVVFAFLFYPLHRHASDAKLLGGLSTWISHLLRQALFILIGVSSGCYLIYITNRHGYLAVMKQAPTLGCLWVWSVIELDLIPAVLSLAMTGGFYWQGDYSFR